MQNKQISPQVLDIWNMLANMSTGFEVYKDQVIL